MAALGRFISYSNVHIALVAAGLVTGTWTLLQLPFSWPALALCCTGAFLVYLSDRVWLFRAEDEINRPDRIAWYRRHRAYPLVAVAAGLWIAATTVRALPPKAVLFGGLLALAGAVYLWAGTRPGLRLKGHWLVKPLVISVAWAAGGVLFPVLAVGAPLDPPAFGLALYRLPLVFANVLLADWPDRVGDEVAHLHTLAVRFDAARLSTTAAVLACVSLGIGAGIGGWQRWPLSFFVDLAGPVWMILLARRMEALDGRWLALLADLVVAWPLVTALLVHGLDAP